MLDIGLEQRPNCTASARILKTDRVCSKHVTRQGTKNIRFNTYVLSESASALLFMHDA